MGKSPPAQGERNAMAGYNKQYRIGAQLILHHLQQHTLEWIRIADPQAGRVDDFQIGSPRQADAYQIKWHDKVVHFSFNDLAGTSKDDPVSLIEQLADGWQRLRTTYQGKRIVVHLKVNSVPSTATGKNVKIPLGNPPPAQPHFAAFLQEAWAPVHAASSPSLNLIPQEWRAAWTDLQQASKLSEQDFLQFVPNCELELAPFALGQTSGSLLEEEQRHNDEDKIRQLLADKVGDSKQLVELTRDDLLRALNWEQRFQLLNRHEFPINVASYIPIAATITQIKQALHHLSGGYIAVLGTPGSGKSTLLTQLLRGRTERVIRYYAYVPDAQDPSSLRGDATAFLHDMVISLDQSGISPDGNIAVEHDRLLLQFHQQLYRLGEDYQRTQRKTIILIDGLDHIGRNPGIQRSLLGDLPEPRQVPTGVYLVLGSQTDQLTGLQPAVQRAIQHHSRRIEMQPLSRAEVMAALAGTSLRVDNAVSEQIFILSGGHPLALHYLIDSLEQAPDQEAVASILDATHPYTGDIEDLYLLYWRSMVGDGQLEYLAGLLARFRRVIDFGWLRTWNDASTVNLFQQRFRHYFRRETENRWYFFHESFRLFLKKITAETNPGEIDTTRDQYFHHEIAEACAHQPEDQYWAWEEFYHRLEAGENPVILQRATPQYFRKQLLSFRPVQAVDADIRLTLRSLQSQPDPVTLTRIILAGAETASRKFYLEDKKLAPLLLALGQEQRAISCLRDGHQLRVSAQNALESCADLIAHHLHEEARRIFQLAEPLDLLAAAQPIEKDFQYEKTQLLETWGRAVPYFLSIESILQTVRNLHRAVAPGEDFDEQTSTRLLQNAVIMSAGLTTLDLQEWGEFARCCDAFDPTRDEDRPTWFLLHRQAWRLCIRLGEPERAKGFLAAVLAEPVAHRLDVEERIDYAEGLWRLYHNVELTRQWLTNLPQPALRTDLVAQHAGMRPFLYRFKLSRLCALLGDRRGPAEIIPRADDPQLLGLVYLERGVIQIARLMADAERGHPLDPRLVQREVLPLLRLFNYEFPVRRKWTAWLAIDDARAEFYQYLVRAISRSGTEATLALYQAFTQEWENEQTATYWPDEIERAILLAFARTNIDLGPVNERLRKLEGCMLDEKDVAEQVETCLQQTRAWIQFDELEAARENLTRAIKVAFGVSSKDYQFQAWFEWLDEFNKTDPGHTAERMAWFARLIAALKSTLEVGVIESAVNELLHATFMWSPLNAVRLYQWLLEKGVIRYEVGLRGILHAALDHPQPPLEMILAIIADLVLPIATHADPKLVTTLIQRGGQTADISWAQEAAQSLLLRQHLALSSTRHRWRYGIATGLAALQVNPQEMGVGALDLQPTEDDRDHSDLRLKDDTTLTYVEVKGRVTTVDDARLLYEQEANNSYFDWHSLVSDLCPTFNQATISALADLFESDTYAPRILADLSRRLYTLGDSRGAWKMGYRALTASKPNDWDRYWGSTGRLDALAALKHINPRQARQLARDTLFADLLHEYWYPQNLALNLREILPLLFEEPLPLTELWQEIFSYLHVLSEHLSLPLDDLLLVLQSPHPSDTPEAALLEVLSKHLTHPVTVLRQGANRAIGTLLRRSSTGVERLLHALFTGSDQEQAPALAILEALELEGRTVRSWKGEIIACTTSPNAAIRLAAQRLCQHNDWPFSSPPERALAPTYSLWLPERGPAPRPHLYKETLPDSPDPTVLVQPFDMELTRIAEMADIPYENLCQRAVQIMRQLAEPDTWSEAAEQRLRSMLNTIHLRLPYVRPRTARAQQAVYYIIDELLDAREWSSDQQALLERLARYYDPRALTVMPQHRPTAASPLSGLGSYGERKSEWLASGEQGFEAVARTLDDGRHVLAEETRLKLLDWAIPSEIRQAVVQLPRLHPQMHPNHTVFHEVEQAWISEYPSLQVGEIAAPLIIRHVAYGYLTDGANWLAFNPVIGFSLKWRLADHGLFRWVDQEGQIMVESLWWKDGLLEQAPPSFNDEVGGGWLIAASPDAVHQLRQHFPALRHSMSITRSFHEDGQEYTHTARRIEHW